MVVAAMPDDSCSPLSNGVVNSPDHENYELSICSVSSLVSLGIECDYAAYCGGTMAQWLAQSFRTSGKQGSPPYSGSTSADLACSPRVVARFPLATPFSSHSPKTC